ncbi:MAG: ankyrin repeat domain-containing protein [Planctomycetota bacterium]|nr:ankyrin repeat domain-containing protein [Planctomycetota bacterium]
MATAGGARHTVIAAVIGLSAGFLAVTMAVVLLLVLAGGFTSFASIEDRSASFVLQLLPDVCLAGLLGFSVWVQAWTRGLRYSWARCTLSSLTGAVLTALLAGLLVWLFGTRDEPRVLSATAWLPFMAGMSGDFGGVGLYVGLRERRVAWFFLSSLGVGSVLPLVCWLLCVPGLFSYWAVFLAPLAVIAYFAVFHIVLDLLWRGGSATVGGEPAAPSRGLLWARGILLGIFVGAPLVAGVACFFTVPLPMQAHDWVRGDGVKLREELDRHPKLLGRADDMGRTLLHQAAFSGTKAAVEVLLAKGADVNERTRFGETPLHEVANRGHTRMAEGLEIAQLLLQHKADPNVVAKLGGTPLHRACRDNLGQLAELLLKNGANPNAPDVGFKRAPLFEVAKEGFETLADLLLRYSADPNARDSCGVTPLQVATENNRQELVEFLLQRGADVNAESRLGQSALSIALKKGYPKIAEVLRARGAQEKKGQQQ